MILNVYVVLACFLAVSRVGGQNITYPASDHRSKYELLTKLFEEVQDILQAENSIANLESTTLTSLKDINSRDNDIDEEQTDLEPGNQNMVNEIGEADKSDILKGIIDLKQSMELLYKGTIAEKIARKKNTESLINLEVTIAATLKEIANETDEIIEHISEMSSKLAGIANVKTELKLTGENIDQCNLNIKSLDGKVEQRLDGIDREIKLSNDKIEQCDANVKKLSSKVDVIYLGMRAMMTMMDTNIALGKRATENSTYTDQHTKLGPNAATDGNKNGIWSGGSCTHTRSQKDPWWKVDLEGQFYIRKVVIKNREDCCGDRLHDLVITVSQVENGDEVKCGEFKGPGKNGSTETIRCEPDIMGRFVKIQINGNGALTLCEVEIFT